MRIRLAEPVSPRYIYINPETNKVHLMLPVVSGTSIGLDNTCKAVHSLQEFLGKSLDPKQVTALNELTQDKTALEFDLKYIAEDNPLADSPSITICFTCSRAFRSVLWCGTIRSSSGI